jgi:hypothetical protein
MAEETQPTKRHKNNITSTLTDIQECELIGVHLPTPLVNPIGDEAKVDAPLANETFMDSDARLLIDDNLSNITRDLPEFQTLHAQTAEVIMTTAEQIEVQLERSHAYQHIRKSLKDAISLMEASTIKLATELAQAKLSVSTAKTAVEEYNSTAQASVSSEMDEDQNDEDLAEGLVPSDAPSNTYTKLTATHQSEVDNLDSLKAAHTLLHSELALWKGTLKEVKRLLSVNKKNFHKTNKRANPGASAGSTDVDLTDVNEWVLSSSPRAPAERVRDPLHSTNPYDRLAALWAEQPVGQTHPFNTTIDRSSLTKPKGGESKEVLCKTTATIIFYKLPTDTALCLRYINALDFPRPATRLRVIKPKGNRAGEAQIPVVITRMTTYIWRLLEQRVVYFKHDLAVGIRHAVNDENSIEPRHAWVERVPNTPAWLPRNYPFGIQEVIWRILGVRVVLMPKKLDLSWYEGICLSTSGLDIVFQTTKDLITFMGHTDPGIPLYIAQGGVSNTTARIMGDVFTMDEALGAYAIDFLNLPRTITAERLLTTLQGMGQQPYGFKDVTKGRGYNGSILRVGFQTKQLRHRAVLQLSGQIFPALHRAPLRVSLARDIPKGHCFKCGRKGHSARDTSKCTPTCYICHKPLSEMVDGEAVEHECLYVQEDYDPLAFKQTFMNQATAATSVYATPTQSQPRPSYFTSPQGRLPSPPRQDHHSDEMTGEAAQGPRTLRQERDPGYQQGPFSSPPRSQYMAQQPPAQRMDIHRSYVQQSQPQPVYYTADGQAVYLQPAQPPPQYAPPQGYPPLQSPGSYVSHPPSQGYRGAQYAPQYFHQAPPHPQYQLSPQQQYQPPLHHQYQPQPQQYYQYQTPPQEQGGQTGYFQGQERSGWGERQQDRDQGGPSPVPRPASGVRRTLSPADDEGEK